MAYGYNGARLNATPQSQQTDFLLAIAQILLAFVMALGFLAVIFVLIFYHGALDQVTNTLLTGLAGVLGTIVTQQSGYFFQRQRPPTLPDPSPPGAPTLSGVFNGPIAPNATTSNTISSKPAAVSPPGAPGTGGAAHI
jgi:hypothetical protein